MDSARADSHYTVISYFCSYTEAAHDAEAVMLRSLLYQIVQLKPESGSIIWNRLAVRAGEKTKFILTSEKLWEALIEALSMHSTARVCLVLDAIEELGHGTAKSVLKNLGRMTAYLGDRQPISRLKLFVSSRRSYTGSKINCELLRMDRGEMRSDIRAYLDHVVEDFAQRSTSFGLVTSPSTRRKIAEGILSSSDGTFLVAVLSWDNFRQGTKWSQEAVRKKLKSIMPLMSDMEDFYDRMLLKGNEDAVADAEIIFSILAAAARPLTELELEEFAGMCVAGKRIRKSTHFSPFRHLIHKMEEMYPGLISVQDNHRVTLIHRSFKDYLENTDRAKQVIHMERRYFVRACLQYIQLEDLIQDAKSGLTRYGSFTAPSFEAYKLTRECRTV